MVALQIREEPILNLKYCLERQLFPRRLTAHMQDQNLLKEALKKYKKSNYHIQSWSEYSKELNKLTDKVVAYVQANTLNVDAVVPILRGGNIPATFIAYTLDVLTILPVQYKYFFNKQMVLYYFRI